MTVLDSFSLADKVAVVTGTTRGLGRVLALALAEAGADIVHLNRSANEEVENACRDFGRASTSVFCELNGDADQLGKAIGLAHGWQERIDILVNSAGIVSRGPILDRSATEINEVLQVDLVAPMHLSLAAARLMIGQGGGKIINIASLMSFQGGLNVAAYATAKSGLAGLTRALANEWGSQGICVNALVPGYIATEINADLRADETRAAEFRTRIPAGRWGTPSDLVGGLIFLASQASNYVNGHLLVIDGGWMSR